MQGAHLTAESGRAAEAMASGTGAFQEFPGMALAGAGAAANAAITFVSVAFAVGLPTLWR